MPKTKTAAQAKRPAPARKTAARPAPRPERKVKEIAGVKVPKDLREVAAAAQKLMENPLVRDIVSAGVLAAMAAFAESQQKKPPRAGAVGDAAEELGRNSAGLKKTAKVVAGAAAGAMGKRLMDEVKTRGPELIAKIDKPKRDKREDRNAYEDEAAAI